MTRCPSFHTFASTILLASCTLASSMSAAIAAPTDCESIVQEPLTAIDMPDVAMRAGQAGCDSEALYDTASDAGEWARVRDCALIEREHGDETPFTGSSMLMLIYANGLGTERDFDLARRFACEAGGAPAEVEARLAHLEEMESSDDPNRRIDICDDITSGMMSGFCAERGARASADARRASQDAMLALWSAQDRSAWAALRRAADVFFEARLQGEVDVSGSARGAFIVGEKDSLEEGLMSHIAAFERGELPRASSDDLAAADAQLNATYAKARAAARPENADDIFGPLGTIRPEGIRDAERAWIRYRDAWVTFGAQRYPRVAADAWKTHFTRERSAQLAEMAGEE